ncbi:MAG: hypothetical protein JOZ62_01280 [Acidobacteriaceae bacterium]|nr:hypothetical protein [Acidobacteriaceae bacterium]
MSVTVFIRVICGREALSFQLRYKLVWIGQKYLKGLKTVTTFEIEENSFCTSGFFDEC